MHGVSPLVINSITAIKKPLLHDTATVFLEREV